MFRAQLVAAAALLILAGGCAAPLPPSCDGSARQSVNLLVSGG